MFTKTAVKTISKILYVSILSFGLVFLLSNSVSAKNLSDMTPAEQAESISYYDSLRDCVENNMRGTIKTTVGEQGAADPLKVSWFDGGSGYVFQNKSTTKRECKAIVGPALALWGWGTDYTGFLKQMGYTYDSNGPEWKGTSNGSDRQNAFDSAVQSTKRDRVFLGNFTGYAFNQLTDSAKFELYQSKLSTCKARNLGLLSSVDDTVKNLVNNGSTRDALTYTKVNFLDPENSRVKVYAYSYGADVSQPVLYGYDNTGSKYGQQKASCGTILSEVSRSAQGYAFYNAQVSCKDAIGVTKQSEIDACANGYLNTPLTYCKTKYTSNTEDRKACYKGQGNEAAELCTIQGYTSTSILGACIAGSKNKTQNYCETTYVGVFSAGQSYSMDAERAACKYGQALEISGATVKPESVNSQCTTDPSATGCATESGSSCVIEGIGWILCPVVNFMGGIVDAAYTFVSGLLVVQPLLTTGNSLGMYNAWVVMRNLANIAFVIVFLIIIFSQLTNMGVSNYGVKKMLPRLVIAAILVNVSYWICAVAIDLSNIAGSSMVTVFNGVSNSIAAPLSADSPISTGNGLWIGLAGTVLAGAGTVGILYYIGIAALLPALISALVAIVTVFLVLTLRQALIILLIVVSPLAFVAFLLPNTEELFTKWRKLLVTLLLMYPIIAGLFGAAALASQVVMTSSPDDVVVQIMGALIAIIPLALTPIVMKSAGGVLNRFGGMVNNPNKGPFDRMRKGAESLKKDQNTLRNRRALDGAGQFGRGAMVRFGARRKGIVAGRENELNRANAGYLAGQVKTNSAYRNAAAGGTMRDQASGEAEMRAQSNAISTLDKIQADEINAASVVLKEAKIDMDGMRALANGRSATGAPSVVNGVTVPGSRVDAGASVAMQQAAIRGVVASNDVKGMNDLWDQSRSWSGEGADSLRTTLADSLQASSSRPVYFGQGAIAGLRLGNHKDSNQTVVDAIKANAYSPDKIAGADKDELNVVATVSAAPSTDPTFLEIHRTQLANNAKTAMSDPKLATTVAKNIDQVRNIGGMRPPAEPLT